MMREHLYRGIREDNGDWAEGHYFVDVIQDEDRDAFIHVPYIMTPYGDHYQQHEIKLETVGQYTGLKDKNGVKIFEGDIVRNQYERIGVIVFEGVGFRIKWNEISDSLIVWQNKLEAIGNIHDNPELLEANP